MESMKYDAMQTDAIVRGIRNVFLNRVLFIGQLGSHSRKEACLNSEIDIIIILDKLNINDILNYKKFIHANKFNPAINGLIFGKNEFANWSKLELFCLLYETIALYGNLNLFISSPDKKEINQAIKLQAGYIYYKLTKSLINCSQDIELKQKIMKLYKQAFFILQMKYYLEENIYVPTKLQLMEKLEGLDRIILNNCINKEDIITKNKQEVLFLSKLLIDWTSEIISGTNIKSVHLNSLEFDKGKTLTYEKVKEILGLE